MGNCLRLVYKATRKKRSGEKTIVLLVVGLDNSGKTLVLNRISGDRNQNVLPTVGFRIVSLKYKSVTVKLYDLGGGPQIRAIWSKYYADVYGLIYVVDASDTSRLSENKTVFKEVISHEHVAGKPILLLANKQDVNGAIDELDLVENLNVEQAVNNMRCPTRIETCSCIYNEDISDTNVNGITEGYKWLMDTILRNYTHLNNRVKLAEKNENNKRRKSSVSSRISAWSNSLRSQQNSQKQQENSDTPGEIPSNGEALKARKKFFLLKNKTAPMLRPAKTDANDTQNDIPVTRRKSHEEGFLEKPVRSDLELRQSIRRGENSLRPKTAPQIIQNNFFN